MDTSPYNAALEQVRKDILETRVLSLGRALDQANELIENGQQAASDLESAGNPAQAGALYEQMVEAISSLVANLPEDDQEVLRPLADFWTALAKATLTGAPEAGAPGPTSSGIENAARETSIVKEGSWQFTPASETGRSLTSYTKTTRNLTKQDLPASEASRGAGDDDAQWFSSKPSQQGLPTSYPVGAREPPDGGDTRNTEGDDDGPGRSGSGGD